MDRVLETVDAQPDPVVLVGHSFGGVVVSQAAEQRPDRIARLVYLTAFLLKNGDSASKINARGTQTFTRRSIILSPDRKTTTVHPDALHPMFYHDCPDEDVVLASSLLVPEPVAPRTTPVTITDANFGRIPRTYVECLNDAAIPLALQRAMHAALPCEKVVSLNSSHSPFFSVPVALARAVISSLEEGS